MSKVKVSKDLFDALEKNKEQYGLKFPYDFIWDFVRGCKVSESNFLLTKASYKEVIEASVKGYELELTPHEIIKLEFEKKYKCESVFNEGFYNGILFVLNTLGEKVEGVNK